MTFVTVNTFESDVANDTEFVMQDFDIGDNAMILQTDSNFQVFEFDDVGISRHDEITTKSNSTTKFNPLHRKARDGFIRI